MKRLTLRRIITVLVLTALIGVISSVIPKIMSREDPNVAQQIVNCPMSSSLETDQWQLFKTNLASYPGWPWSYLVRKDLNPITEACAPQGYSFDTAVVSADLAIWLILATLLTAAIEHRPKKSATRKP